MPEHRGLIDISETGVVSKSVEFCYNVCMREKVYVIYMDSVTPLTRD
ncbi:MAG: hypothetical protein GXO97_08815 [Nitrospirae bacterium]|nr:hypothetical protein [Nitrospirota bacterium]